MAKTRDDDEEKRAKREETGTEDSGGKERQKTKEMLIDFDAVSKLQ